MPLQPRKRSTAESEPLQQQQQPRMVDGSASPPSEEDEEPSQPTKGKRARRHRITRNACRQCRHKKTKCDGLHPTCARCRATGLTCEYDVSEGVTKMQSLKDQLDARTRELESTSAILRVLVEGSDQEATELLARLRLTRSAGQQVPTSLPNHLDPQLFSHSQTLFSLLNPPQNPRDQPPQLQNTTIQPPFGQPASKPPSPMRGNAPYRQDYQPWQPPEQITEDMDAEGSPASGMSYSQASAYPTEPTQQDVQSEARRFATAMPYGGYYPGQAPRRSENRPPTDEPSAATGSWDPNNPSTMPQPSQHQQRPWGGR